MISIRARGFTRFLRSAPKALVLPIVFVTMSCGSGLDPVPKEMKGIELGALSKLVVDTLKDDGEISRSDVPYRPPRVRITWTPKRNQYYESVDFDFTEYDRLYLIRFNLRRVAHGKAHALKKGFFRKFRVSWDDPGTIRLHNRQALLYIPEEKSPFFFDVKYVRTGDKTYELFDKEISGGDKIKYKKSKEAGETPAKENGGDGEAVAAEQVKVPDSTQSKDHAGEGSPKEASPGKAAGKAEANLAPD